MSDVTLDLSTGQTRVVPLTPAQLAERRAAAAAASAEQETIEAAAAVAETNTRTIHTEAEQALAGLRQITNSTGILSAAQLSNAARLTARVLIVLIRLQLRRLDATD